MTEPNCDIIEYVPPPIVETPAELVAKKCKDLIAHYRGDLTHTNPIIECGLNGFSNVFAEWDGTGEPDILEWHLGWYVNIGTPTQPKWAFQDVVPKIYGNNVVFLNVPPSSTSPTGEYSILLVAKIGNCSGENAQNIGPICLACGGSPNPPNTAPKVSFCSDCCIKTFDICNP
jgi:hypothetical protein